MGADTSHPVGCVVAIDFGTSNSGYAYCLKRGNEIKLDSDPLWIDGRTSTDLLMDSQMAKALEFGPMAGKSYRKSLNIISRNSSAVDLHTRPQANLSPILPDLTPRLLVPTAEMDSVPVYNDPVLLEKIKLQVLALTNPRDFRLKSAGGEQVHATKAFAEALSYMKQRCLDNISEHHGPIDPRVILWIVTVPAAWGNLQRNFMTLAANESGVMASATAQNFTILTESETSVAFCRQLLPDDFKDKELARNHMSHQNYMVVDAGGGTVDICIVKKTDIGRRDETETITHRTSGGRWGGHTVNEKFEQFLIRNSRDVGKFVSSFRQARIIWKTFQDGYENMKQRSSDDDITITVSKDLIDCYEDLVDESFFDHLGGNTKLECNRSAKTITFKEKYLHRKQFHNFFEELKDLFNERGCSGIWESFYEDYVNQNLLFQDSGRDRTFDFFVRTTQEFQDKYKEIKGMSFADIFWDDAIEGVVFDKKRGGIFIPADVMRWCWYDEYISARHKKIDKKLKKRAAIWAGFMDSFEEVKREFTGEKNLQFDLKHFPQRYKCVTGKSFLSDAIHEGIRLVKRAHGKKLIEISNSVIIDKCFHPVLDEMKGQLERFYSKGVGLLYLVGGFGKCGYVQKYIKDSFASERGIIVLVPKSPSTSVLQGTIHYAYERISTARYKAECTLFVQSTSSNLPEVIVTKGSVINISDIHRVPTKSYKKDDISVIELRASTAKNPTNTSASKVICEFTGLVDTSYWVTVAFDNNYIRVYLDEEGSGNSMEKRLNKESISKDKCTIQ